MKIIKPVVPILLLIAAGLLIIFTLNTGQDWGGDFSSYIMQAQSLVEGSPRAFVEANQFTIDHSTRHIAPVAYPWGFSAMLAPVYAGFGPDIFVLKSVGVVCYLLFLVVLWVGFRDRHPGAWLWCLIALFALNPAMLMYLNRVLSDVPFMLFSTVCVLMIGRYVIDQRRLVSPSFDSVLLGVLIAAACLIRTNGVVLVPTLFASQVINYVFRSRRRAERDSLEPSADTGADSSGPSSRRAIWIAALPYAAFFIVIVASRLLLPSGESEQLDILSEISLGTLWYHFFYYGNMPAEFYGGVSMPYLVYLVSLPLVVLGVYKRRHRDHPMAVFVLLTFSLYVVYPPLAGFRFMFPMMPFYISFMLSGLQVLQGASVGGRPTLRRVACLFPVALILVCFSVQSVSNARDNMSRSRATLEGPYTDPSSEVFAFIMQETGPDSVFVFFKPRVLRLVTGRRAFTTRSNDEFTPGDYLVMYLRDESKQLSLQAADRLEQRGVAEPVFDNRDFRVYRLTEAGGPESISD